MPSIEEAVATYRETCLKNGTYLAAPSEEYTWFSVRATNASYLIRASDAPDPADPVDSDYRPPPAELSLICKVAEHDWWFRAEANWTKQSGTPDKKVAFERVRLTFIAEPANETTAIEDFKAAKSNLSDLMDMVATPGLFTEGGFAEPGLRVRHAIFGRRHEVPTEVFEDAKFDIAKWPVFTSDAKAELADMVGSHYIRTPPVYDIPGQLIKPDMYFKRLRGAVVAMNFTFTFYKWGKKNTFCADLSHLRVLVTPSPLSPVTPKYKRNAVVAFDQVFGISQPDFKKAKKNAGDAPPLPGIKKAKKAADGTPPLSKE